MHAAMAGGAQRLLWDGYKKRVTDAIESIDPSLVDRLELSVLSERRYAPQF